MDWYYIGHYGQLGPLTREQVDELIGGGVILRETFVWRAGMAQWLPAGQVVELQIAFKNAEPLYPTSPPPPPSPSALTTSTPPPTPQAPYGTDLGYSYPSMPAYPIMRSDRSRTTAGILQIIPGVGRMYLGYAAYGALQLVLSFCMVGLIWSWIDGLLILTGGVKLDGYGRQLAE